MNSPQDRIIKKMIDNIVEQNKPSFEKPAADAESSASSGTSGNAPAIQAEDYNLISRKLEYGFSGLRAENAELRKAVDELSGMLKMLRNDMDQVRMSIRNQQHAQAEVRQEAPAAPVNVSPTAMGAPQYRKSAADEAFESSNGGNAVPANDQPVQARGFAPKKDPAVEAGVDISKVFYYGKK